MESEKVKKWLYILAAILMIATLVFYLYDKNKELEKVEQVNYTSPADAEQALIEAYIQDYVKSQGYGLDYYSAGEKRLFALSKNPFINGSFYQNSTN